MHTVLETTTFSQSAKGLGLTEAERHQIADRIGNDPLCGDLIKGTGGARKIRFPRHGKGKSGGYRVVTYYGGDDVPVFLLDIYSKGERIDLSQAERNELKSLLSTLADDYRASMTKRVQGLSESA